MKSVIARYYCALFALCVLAPFAVYTQSSGTQNELVYPGRGSRYPNVYVHTVTGSLPGATPPVVGFSACTPAVGWRPLNQPPLATMPVQSATAPFLVAQGDPLADELSTAGWNVGNCPGNLDTFLFGGGLNPGYYSQDTGATWMANGLVFGDDESILHSPSGNHPLTYYQVSLDPPAGVPITGILVQQSDDGGQSWNNPIHIASPGGGSTDFCQSVVDNLDRVWVVWYDRGNAHQYWAVVNHTNDGSFHLSPNPVVHTLSATRDDWWTTRLICDPVTNFVYAIRQPLLAGDNTRVNIQVARLGDGDLGGHTQDAPIYSGIATDQNVGIRKVFGFVFGTGPSYVPGMRPGFEDPTAAAYNHQIYVVWNETHDNVTDECPRVLKLQGMLDDGMNHLNPNGCRWTFTGSNPGAGQRGWNSPYRPDICVGFRPSLNRVVVALVFYGSNSDGAGHDASTDRDVLTTTGDLINNPNSGWVDTWLSQPAWQWSDFTHFEWYRCWMDPTTTTAYHGWIEDTPGQPVYRLFFNAIQP